MSRNPETGPASSVQRPASGADAGRGTRDGGRSAEADDYCLTVESHFAERRGTPFIFSAKDWAVLQQWRDSGVPLPVVIEAIDQCFDKREKAGRHKIISSLRYCRHAVNELWEERKQLLVGGGAELPEQDPTVRLMQLADEIHASSEAVAEDRVRAQLIAAADQIRAIGAGKSVPLIEEELLEIEETLIDRLMDAIDHDERVVMEGQISTELRGYSTADPAVLEKTRKANLRRLLRQRLGLPRLSLFG